MMRKVVVFDIGDILLFTAFERAGKFLEEELGIPAKKVTDLFWGRAWGGRALEWFLNLSEGTDEQFHAIAEEMLGRTIPEGLFWEMWNKEWVPNEPVIRIVNRLSAMLHPPALAICSNINQPHWTHLCSTYAVFRHFSVAALSYRVGKMKPDHAMFRFVTEQVTASDVAPPFFSWMIGWITSNPRRATDGEHISTSGATRVFSSASSRISSMRRSDPHEAPRGLGNQPLFF